MAKSGKKILKKKDLALFMEDVKLRDSSHSKDKSQLINFGL
jgi:hypothetical protein